MGAHRGRLSTPWLRFHGVDRADVYIIIHVRACCCGECALNPPPSRPIPHRRPSLAPAQRHALPEYFRSSTQPRHTPADCATHFPPTAQPIPRRSPSLAPAQRHALPEHFCSPPQPRRTPAGCAMHSPPTSPPIPRRSSTLALTQRHALAEHFRSSTQRRRTPAGCAMHARSAQCIPRRPHDPFPAAPPCLPFRSASGTKKRHRTVDVRCRMSRSTVVAVGHWGW